MSERAKTPTDRVDPARPISGKQRLLEAAELLFSANGFPGVSAAAIAKEAGVAYGLLFHHFGSMEALYAEVSRIAVERMDNAQLNAFRGKTVREQIGAFLRAHMRAMRQRQGDALFRARAYDVVGSGDLARIWDASRRRAMERVFEVLGVKNPSKKMRVCLRGWIGFYDQLVLGWLADGALKEAEVVEWTLRQLDHLAAEVFCVDLQRPAA
jgi:AcrR family transcriptional regulator